MKISRESGTLRLRQARRPNLLQEILEEGMKPGARASREHIYDDGKKIPALQIHAEEIRAVRTPEELSEGNSDVER